MSLPYEIRNFDRDNDAGFVLGTYGSCTAHAPGMRHRKWVKLCAQCLCLRIVDDPRWKTAVAMLPGGQLVGWASTRDENCKHRLFFCYVKHAFRREGIATALVNKLAGHKNIVHAPMPIGPVGEAWLKRIGSQEEDSRIP